MTIDEAIKHAREVAEDNREKAMEFCKPYDYMYGVCEKCANEHEQLAEWLEELKERQQSNFDYVQLMDVRYKAGYTKAIDDFAEALKKRYPIMENGLFTINDVLQKEIDRIAEQLKEGSADNE